MREISDARARHQAELSHPGGLQLTSRAAKLAGISRGMALLDIGCGDGASLEHLCRKFGVLPFGIDISSEAIGLSRERLPQASLTVGSADELPFENEAFDAVMCECVLSLMADTSKALNEVRRVLKVNGIFVASDVCEKSDIERVKAAFELAGFTLLHFEDHRQALVTYLAEALAACEHEDAFPSDAHFSHSTYYMTILRKCYYSRLSENASDFVLHPSLRGA